MKNILGVPLIETGIEYPASTGPVTFTTDDLADIVIAQNDPAIHPPRLKLGHTDSRFTLDGEPSFGVTQNLRVENGGHTLICDYVGVPDWLAAVMPTAYPSRSVEGNWDVETVTGHKYRFVITDVALLGVVWPGISTIADLEVALSDAGPEGVSMAALAASVSVEASVNMEDIRRTFYDEYATEEAGRFWWWIRAVLLEPNELIVDDDDGGLYRVPFAPGDDSVTFSDPIPVKIEYVDAPVAAKFLSAQATVCASSYTDSRSSRPANRQEGTVANVTASVDLELLRRALGLAEDATEDQVNEALRARAESPQPDPQPSPGEPAPQPGDPAPPTEPEPQPEPQPQPEPSAIAASEGTVAVDRETLAQLQRDATLGRQAFESQRVAARDTFLHAAVAAGKFPPARLQHWTEAWERDPEGIMAQVNQMPAGLIPVGAAPLGGAPNVEAGQTGPSYPKEWLPEVHGAAHSTITQES